MDYFEIVGLSRETGRTCSLALGADSAFVFGGKDADSKSEG